MDALQAKLPSLNKVLSFYNMVQIYKNLHKQYLDDRKEGVDRILHNYIPFYSEIELITLTKETIFHQLIETKANIYYHKLWMEICERMQWQMVNSKGIVIDIHPEQPVVWAGIGEQQARFSNS
ncbi:MAG: hypothetical protein JWM28_2111 [Chitinophagaceae bacterium]|nr:hypothetical protein [Chitinophagaceae bacterium]